MLRFLEKAIVILALFLFPIAGNSIFAQVETVDIAVQQGHANDIEFVAVSGDLNYFATYGKDNRLVLWDYRTGSQMAFSYLEEPLSALNFGPTSSNLFIKSAISGKGLKLDIETMIFSPEAVIPTVFKDKSQCESAQFTVTILGAKIILTDKKNGKIKKKTSDYFDQPFNSVQISYDEKLILAACEDGLIYVFNTKLKLIDQFKGHNSGATDVVLTKDNHYLFSVSRDRSIIKWDLRTGEQIARYTGKSFPIYGLSLNDEAKTLLFGDDVGYVKQLEISENKIEIQSDRKSLHPILFTHQISDSVFMYSGQDNGLFFNCLGEPCEKMFSIKYNPKRLAEYIFTQGFNYYRPPFSVFHSYSVSPSKNLLALSTDFSTKNPEYSKIIDFSDINNLKESARLFPEGHRNISVVCFLNDSIVAGTYTSQSIIFWKTTQNNLKEVYSKTVVAPANITHLSRLNDSILIAGNNNTLFFYTDRIGWFDKMELTSVQSLHHLDKNLFAVAIENNSFVVVSCVNGVFQKSGPFLGHLDSITSIQFNKERNLIFSTSLDGMIIVWDRNSQQQKVTFIPVGSHDFVCLTPDNFYMTSGKNMKSFGFKLGGRFIYPEQFDPYYNRPDIVLQRLGYHDSTLIDAYHRAYLKRLKKLGFSEQSIGADYDLPEISIQNLDRIPSNTDQSTIQLYLGMKDEKFNLDRYTIWVNGVPTLGMKGESLKSRNTQIFDTVAIIHFSEGTNKIQVSCTNINGAESFDETVIVNYVPTKEYTPKTHFIGIGIDKFSEPGHDLSYSVKDIGDLAKALKKKLGNQLTIDTLFNENVSVSNVQALKKKLLQTNINDKVIISYSGHGLLNEEYDYFLSAYNVDFHHPENGGIPYEVLEDLLDSIPARKKLLLIDACHSGEVDKDDFKEMVAVAGAKGIVKPKGGDTENTSDGPTLGLQNSFQLMQELFVNVQKGSGATIISAAAGNQFALEGGKLENGFFTYAILQYMKDHDEVSINALKKYVYSEVEKLSGGMQKPTSRIENLEMDWRVW